MFGSPESEKFYSGTGSMLDGVNNDTLSTPLRRLPNANVNLVLNEINEDRQYNKQAELQPQASNAPISRSSQYASFNDMDNLLPLSEASLQASQARMPFSSMGKDHLFLNLESESKPKPQVFYKPLYHNRSLLPHDFIPPKSDLTTKNIIMRPLQPTQGRNDDELDDDEELVDESTPTGEWMSPVMKEALSRQVNKERIFKNLYTNVFRLVGFHLFILFTEYFYKLYQLNHQYSQVLRKHAAWARYVENEKGLIPTFWPHVHHLQWIFIIAIVISLVRLVWPQDQCVDLPLTDKQRQLVGLKPLIAGQVDDEDDGFAFKKRKFELKAHRNITPPRYLKISGLISSIGESIPKVQNEEPDIALSDVVPSRSAARPLQRVNRLPTKEQEQISKKFYDKFN